MALFRFSAVSLQSMYGGYQILYQCLLALQFAPVPGFLTPREHFVHGQDFAAQQQYYQEDYHPSHLIIGGNRMLPIRRAWSRPHAASVPLVAGMSDFKWPRRCGADWESTQRSQFRYPTCNSQVLTCPGANRRKVFNFLGVVYSGQNWLQ